MDAITLLIATICLRVDPVTIECRTEAVRVERSIAACVPMVKPMSDYLSETYKPEWMAVACKLGNMG